MQEPLVFLDDITDLANPGSGFITETPWTNTFSGGGTPLSTLFEAHLRLLRFYAGKLVVLTEKELPNPKP